MALHHLQVLDLSTRLSGAFCARLFADFSANVTLAEPPEGHALRHEPPFVDDQPGRERSLLHFYANAGKRTVTLAPNDRSALDELLSAADVVVTTEHRHRGIAAGRHGLLHVSITPYGLDGPLAGMPGNDLTAYARAGWAFLNGDPDEPPLKGSHNQAGYLGGLTAFVAAAAAVCERDHSGQGQLIDVSELEALTVPAGPNMLVSAYMGGGLARHKPDMVRGPVPVKDGYFSLTISRAQFWRDAMNILGLHELAEDPQYAAAWYRRKMREHYSGLVEARMREWGKWELFEALATVRCIAGVVLDTRELNENPHLAARGFFVPGEIEGRTIQVPGAPFKMSATPWRSDPTPSPSPPAAPAERGVTSDASAGSEHAAATSSSASPSHAADSRDQRESPPPLYPRSGWGGGRGVGSGPLAGTRAIVLTQAWSGTYATELLGLLGAEVIQIEARRRPDSWRGDYSGAVPEAIRDDSRRQRAWNTNGLYNAVNLNKRAITLDFTEERGRELFRRLVPYADIVAENFSPRVMGNLGLDYAALKSIKPDIILASLSAYGATGPYANVPGIGGTIEPMSGMSALLGYEGGRPQNSGAMYPDPVAGLYCAAGMILALRHRNRTGEGQYIELGMMEANATFIGDALLEYSANGRVRPRTGNRHPRIAPHNIYRARPTERSMRSDGTEPDPSLQYQWLAVSADTDAAWRSLAEHIGRPDLCADPRFATMTGRKQHEAEIDAAIAAWSAEQDATEAAERLLALGVSAAPVWTVLEARQDPQLAARGLFVEVDHPEAGRHLQAGLPWKLSRTPAAVTRPAPMLGEHSREVLAEFLGVTDEEYEELVRLGISGDMPPD